MYNISNTTQDIFNTTLENTFPNTSIKIPCNTEIIEFIKKIRLLSLIITIIDGRNLLINNISHNLNPVLDTLLKIDSKISLNIRNVILEKLGIKEV